MQAYRAATMVDTHREIHIREVPFQPGAFVEVIVLEPAPAHVASASSPPLSPERRAALERTLGRSYHLGGRFPARDGLYER